MSLEKKYPATVSKRRKARKKGDVAKSREFTCFTVLVGAYAVCTLVVSWEELVQVFSAAFYEAGAGKIAVEVLFFQLAFYFAKLLLLMLVPCFVLSLCSEYLQVGLVFSSQSIAFDLSKINFFQGMKKVFSIKDEGRLLEALKYLSLVSIVFLGAFAVVFFEKEMLFGSHQSMFFGLEVLFQMVDTELFFLFGVLGLFAAWSYAAARRKQEERLKMNIQELKQELRESEGDPHTKALRKGLHEQLLMDEIVSGVRRSKVVVVQN